MSGRWCVVKEDQTPFAHRREIEGGDPENVAPSFLWRRFGSSAFSVPLSAPGENGPLLKEDDDGRLAEYYGRGRSAGEVRLWVVVRWKH